MMCKRGKADVEKACMGVAGTVSAEVDLAAKNVTVVGTASVDALKAAITEAGYDVVE
jgi:copper chaperone CopZ